MLSAPALSRRGLLGGLGATLVAPGLARADGSRIARSGSRALDVGDGIAGAKPFVSELAPAIDGVWAAVSYSTRLFSISPSLSAVHVDYPDTNWPSNLVPLADGSLYFQLSAPNRIDAAKIASVGVVDRQGNYRTIPYPKGRKIRRLARLGGGDVIASTWGSPDFYILKGESFATFDARFAGGAPSEVDVPRELVTASDGAVWYLRSVNPIVLGRLDPAGDLQEAHLVSRWQNVIASDLTAFGDGAVVMFLGDPARANGRNAVCVARNGDDRIDLEYHAYEGSPLCGGTVDRRGRLWYLDYKGGALSVVALASLDRVGTVPVNLDPAVVCDGTAMAPLGEDVLIANGTHVERFTLSA